MSQIINELIIKTKYIKKDNSHHIDGYYEAGDNQSRPNIDLSIISYTKVARIRMAYRNEHRVRYEV